MEIEDQKARIIEKFKLIEDLDLINAIQCMLDFALKKNSDIYEVPESDQKLVMDRFERIRKNPERLLDWEEAQKILNEE